MDTTFTTDGRSPWSTAGPAERRFPVGRFVAATAASGAPSLSGLPFVDVAFDQGNAGRVRPWGSQGGT